MEFLENKKHYEWINSSNRGLVDTYLAEDNANIYFESGRFVAKENFGIDLIQITEEIFLKKFKDEIFPKKNLQLNLGNPEQSHAIQNESINEKGEQNPIKIILDKQRKKETISVSLDIKFEVPNRKVIELLDLMFDRDEVIEEIIKSSILKIDNNLIIKEIQNSIKEKILNLFDKEKEDSNDEMQII